MWRRNRRFFLADDTGNAVYVRRVHGDRLAARDLFFCVVSRFDA